MRNKLLTGLVVGGAVGVLAAVLTYARPRFSEGMEMFTYDVRARAAADPGRADPRIVMVDIDEYDIRWVQRHQHISWPWHRELYALATNHLLKQKAAAVVFDFLFLDRGNAEADDVEKFARALGRTRKTVIGLELSRYRTKRPGKRQRYAVKVGSFDDCAKIRKKAHELLWWQTRVFLLPTKEKGCELWIGGERCESELTQELNRLKEQEAFAELLSKAGSMRNLEEKELEHELTDEMVAADHGALSLSLPGKLEIPTFPNLASPLLPLALNARLGAVSQQADRDGLFRHYAPFVRYKNRIYPSLGLAAAMVTWPKEKVDYREGALFFARHKIPLDEHGLVALRFHGSGTSYSRVGMRHVLNNVAQEMENELYEGKKKASLARLSSLLDEPEKDRLEARGLIKELVKKLEAPRCLAITKRARERLSAVAAPSASVAELAQAFKTAAASRIKLAACEAPVLDTMKKLGALSGKTATLSKRLSEAWSALLGLKHPEACRARLGALAADLRPGKGKSPPSGQAAAAARKELAKHLGSEACRRKVHDTLAHYLARADSKNKARFRRVKGVRPGSPEGRIFIIHAAAAALRDLKPTALDPNHLGAEINATFIDNLLNDSFIVRTKRLTAAFAAFLLCLLLGLATFILVAVVRSAVISALSSLIVTVAVTGAYVSLAYVLYRGSNTWLDVSGPALGALLTWASAVATNIYQEGQKRRFVQDALGKYTSAVLVKELMKNPKALSLEWGEKRVITVFFSDVAGFTSISERLGAEKLVALLNDYLTEMTNIVLEHGGIVDKYIGDAIMAFWGAPVDDEEHALNACRVALLSRKRLVELQPKWQEQYNEWIDFRAGINSGEAVAGNMGSLHKYNYTLMGDTVNLASRLEGANKVYETHLMIAQGTYELIKEVMETRQLDFISVKGKDLPVKVYELLGEKGSVDEKTVRLARRFEQGLAAYTTMCFKEALEIFEEILETHPADGPSKLYVARCKEYLESPPEQGWDGVFRMKTK